MWKNLDQCRASFSMRAIIDGAACKLHLTDVLDSTIGFRA
jgi:hypothetical protein